MGWPDANVLFGPLIDNSPATGWHATLGGLGVIADKLINIGRFLAVTNSG